MLINKDKNPTDSIYYISCCVLEEIKLNGHKNVDELYYNILKKYNFKLKYAEYILALDFLFLLERIDLISGGVEYVS